MSTVSSRFGRQRVNIAGASYPLNIEIVEGDTDGDELRAVACHYDRYGPG